MRPETRDNLGKQGVEIAEYAEHFKGSQRLGAQM